MLPVTLKLVGAVLLTLAGSGAGWQRRRSTRLQVLELEQIERLIDTIHCEVQYRALPLDEVYEMVRGSGEFSRLGLERVSGLRELRLPLEIRPERRARLEAFFGELGCAGAEETCRQTEYYLRLCRGYIQAAREEALRAARLELPAGICLGMLAAIVFV